MKYKELKSLVEQVMAELNLAQGKNRIPSKKKSKKRPDYPDVDNDGDKEESMEKALKDKKKHTNEISILGKNKKPTSKAKPVYTDAEINKMSDDEIKAALKAGIWNVPHNKDVESKLKARLKNKMNETYGGLSQSEIEDRIKKDPDFLKKLEDATKKAMNGNTTDLMAIMGGFTSLVKTEYNSPEEEDDVITKPDIEEPAPKTKPRHPLMPPEESPEDEPKMRVKKEGKITINDILTKYKNLKKNEA